MGLQYSIFKLPVETTAVDVDLGQLAYCINGVTSMQRNYSSNVNKDKLRRCVVDNLRVQVKPKEYAAPTFFSEGPVVNEKNNVFQGFGRDYNPNLKYNLPPTSKCVNALDHAQVEPFESEAEMIMNQQTNYSNQYKKKEKETITNEYMPTIVVIVLIIIIIFVIKK